LSSVLIMSSDVPPPSKRSCHANLLNSLRDLFLDNIYLSPSFFLPRDSPTPDLGVARPSRSPVPVDFSRERKDFSFCLLSFHTQAGPETHFASFLDLRRTSPLLDRFFSSSVRLPPGFVSSQNLGPRRAHVTPEPPSRRYP